MSIPLDQLQTIPAALAYWATSTPEAIAQLAPEREPVTYRALHGAVARLAGELRARGLGRHDGIALLFPDGPDFSLALLAAISVGIAVPLAWPNPEASYRPILRNWRVRAIVASTAIPAAVLARAVHDLPLIAFTPGPSGLIDDFQIDGHAVGDAAAERSAEGNDVAVILHSSGTTGSPKLVPRAHHSIASACHEVVEVRGLQAADRFLSSARAAYAQGITAATLPIFVGASQISIPWLDLSAVAKWLDAYQPTYFSTTPAVLRILAADRGALHDAFRRAPIRCVHSAAAPLPAAELRELETMIGAPILNGYGMSEAIGIAGDLFPLTRRVPGSVGTPWCDVRFVDERGEPVADHEIGEIVVRGPRVFAGYLDDPEATAAAFLPGGWFRTGDLGFLDDAGFLHLTGRRNEIVNRGGEKIVPRDVDDVLGAHPNVAEAAVFAVADARLGEDVVAAVVLKPGASSSARELRAWMLDRLAPFTVPRRIWFVEALPRTATGKVQRGELARRWDERQA